MCVAVAEMDSKRALKDERWRAIATFLEPFDPKNSRFLSSDRGFYVKAIVGRDEVDQVNIFDDGTSVSSRMGMDVAEELTEMVRNYHVAPESSSVETLPDGRMRVIVVGYRHQSNPERCNLICGLVDQSYH